MPKIKSVKKMSKDISPSVRDKLVKNLYRKGEELDPYAHATGGPSIFEARSRSLGQSMKETQNSMQGAMTNYPFA